MDGNLLLPLCDGKMSGLVTLIMFRSKLTVEYFQILSSMCQQIMIWVGNFEARIF